MVDVQVVLGGKLDGAASAAGLVLDVGARRQEPPTPMYRRIVDAPQTHPRPASASTLTPQMSVMTLLDNHLEQISLCAASIAELQYAIPTYAAICSSDPRPALPRPRYSPMRCYRITISQV